MGGLGVAARRGSTSDRLADCGALDAIGATAGGRNSLVRGLSIPQKGPTLRTGGNRALVWLGVARHGIDCKGEPR